MLTAFSAAPSHLHKSTEKNIIRITETLAALMAVRSWSTHAAMSPRLGNVALIAKTRIRSAGQWFRETMALNATDFCNTMKQQHTVTTLTMCDDVNVKSRNF